MTPEQQAVVDRIMGLADEAIEDAEEAMRERCARGPGQRVYNQQKVESRTALRATIEELALQAAPAGLTDEQERAAFESVIGGPPYERDVRRFADDDSSAWPGNYRDINVDLAWHIWQARAALSAPEQAAQQADARDAARYRWLRSVANSYRLVPRVIRTQVIDGVRATHELTGDDLDAAIDAAMTASKKEG